MNKKTIIIIVAVVAVLCLLCAVVVAVAVAFGVGMTAPAASQGDAFMKALNTNDYAAAYELCSPNLKTELGDMNTLQGMIEGQGLVPEKWSFSSTNVNNDTAEMAGEMTTKSGNKASVSIVLGKTGEKWLITGFHFVNQ